MKSIKIRVRTANMPSQIPSRLPSVNIPFKLLLVLGAEREMVDGEIFLMHLACSASSSCLFKALDPFWKEGVSWAASSSIRKQSVAGSAVGVGERM